MTEDSSDVGMASATHDPNSLERPNNENQERWSNACSDSGRSEADLNIEGHPADQERAGLYEDDNAAHNQHLVQNFHLSESKSQPDHTDTVAVDIDIDCDKSTGAHEAKEPTPDEGDGSAETSTARKDMNQKQVVLTSGELLLDKGAVVTERVKSA
ncbi:hypothetical protein LTR99_001202 [Exophiala xenobiotica]|uniref:Uncharacterized protein n=1 Tax=Vermiconidia calcicola TaxID=1690605 RepID=A0AAV9QLH9_9PEZI|nr:hypothetical protein LTR99_001202 [Exophiala xenobiotica]KAK5545763.1 hypothetical protein LTR25_000773 [Vermiconidia calcicola]KAK5549976.1 hypothetical protein LTR23_000267 [Chaetothyriales sp. CCFEE 6169]KAK5372355.1 hypothetical protein LTS13_006093 [Exophiala xenobiotica]KAK5397243.1 hypothetical protein LTR79_005880 [Exophiala xenobiotica]